VLHLGIVEINVKHAFITGVPLATEPGISLIILTPMKKLQRNLNRNTFVVLEMKRNVSVVVAVSSLVVKLLKKAGGTPDILTT